MKACNGDVHLHKAFKDLVTRHCIRSIVETGTHDGHTTAAFAEMLPHGVVYTLEINPEQFRKANHLDQLPTVRRYLGDSVSWLRWHLPEVQQPLLLFLDAHWQMPTPTPHELQAIADHEIRPVIVIHDFKNPQHPEFGWTRYADYCYDFESTRPYLDAIYGAGGYRHWYNEKAVGARRGVLFVEPGRAAARGSPT